MDNFLFCAVVDLVYIKILGLYNNLQNRVYSATLITMYFNFTPFYGF